MLKKIDTEEIIRLFSHFYYWWHFNWGGWEGPGPLATPMNQNAAHNLMTSRKQAVANTRVRSR